MNYLQNHCWCSDSNWGGIYTCRHIVDVSRNLKDESYHDGPHVDWINVTDTKRYFDELSYNHAKKFEEKRGGVWNDELERLTSTKNITILKPEVIEWLNENVKDRKDSECVKGWAYGSDEYLSQDSAVGMSIFFHRRNDAMKFIKTFSVFKKPVFFLNYFKDERKELDMETLKLVKV